jgi:hypothetical protein
MSVEKIVKSALADKPLDMKEAFEEEMSSRVRLALEGWKKKKMSENDDEEEGNDKETCSHCKGTGYHEDDGKKVECEPCDGTGKVQDDDDDDDDDDDEKQDVQEADEVEADKVHMARDLAKKARERGDYRVAQKHDREQEKHAIRQHGLTK